MVKMIPDNMGRFAQRPFYKEQELDAECERIAHQLLQHRRGSISFPITTDDLTVLIEQSGADLDTYADLSRYGVDVEGMTEFFREGGAESFNFEQALERWSPGEQVPDHADPRVRAREIPWSSLG